MTQSRCALLAAVWLIAPSFAAVASAQRCVVDLVVLNRSRVVSGDISAECGGSIHSPPFGNWGVDLRFHPGARRDGFQFPGWKSEGGWLQWNSCTTEPRFAPPNDRYYNNDGFRSQKAWPDTVSVSHSVGGYTRGENERTCEDLIEQNRIVVNRVAIGVYELDPLSPDAHVATLSYGTIEIPYQCDGPWVCTGESEWKEPESGNENVSAELRLATRLRRE